jgi:hypothetical protein
MRPFGTPSNGSLDVEVDSVVRRGRLARIPAQFAHEGELHGLHRLAGGQIT